MKEDGYLKQGTTCVLSYLFNNCVVERLGWYSSEGEDKTITIIVETNTQKQCGHAESNLSYPSEYKPCQ